MNRKQLQVIKKFLEDAETKWPLSIPHNRANAMEWVELMRLDDPEYAQRYENIIKSYEGRES